MDPFAKESASIKVKLEEWITSMKDLRYSLKIVQIIRNFCTPTCIDPRELISTLFILTLRIGSDDELWNSARARKSTLLRCGSAHKLRHDWSHLFSTEMSPPNDTMYWIMEAMVDVREPLEPL